MTKTLTRQRGMTGIGVVMVVAMIAVFVFFGLKIYPIYYESFKVGTQLNSLKTDTDLASKPSADIINLLMRRLGTDNVTRIEKSDITVEKVGKGLRVSVSYSVQEPLIGNIDILVSFDKEVELGN